ncbi:hypothetical protein Aca07nite_18960 [Actinoplanes capillaceus]|uniref:Uncharacterized protein n=1 Tax=Actinoplanes campanulatus TaxID=113559 RepID=A0ABQ3WF71_9ACTN|nr:hypothetical protein Aca07nite_18960 [Actinoplanes capillaceus]
MSSLKAAAGVLTWASRVAVMKVILVGPAVRNSVCELTHGPEASGPRQPEIGSKHTGNRDDRE